jgi:uncharacterized membrane protein
MGENMKNNTKKITSITITIFLLFGLVTLWAQEDEHGRSANAIVDEIKRGQNVETIAEIDPDSVDTKTLEELGDAVMALMIADEAQHEWMDEMMGGEGSEQLDSTHRWMGYQYLQNNGNLGGFGPGMMSGWGYGGGTWGPGMMSGWYGPARMGSQFVAWIWIAGFLLISVAIVLVIVLKQRRRRIENSPVNALEILRARYAKGEISREEFQKIREGLQ